MTPGGERSRPYALIADDGDRLWFVTSRGEVLCLDTEGFHDGENDGPFKSEGYENKDEADIVWRFDMMEEVGSFPHNMSNASPVSFGDLIYVSTSNGQDESHVHIPSPRAPAIIAINKNTGKLAWEDNSVGERILHGQWSSPTVAHVGGVDQVMMGQGDGWIRGYVGSQATGYCLIGAIRAAAGGNSPLEDAAEQLILGEHGLGRPVQLPLEGRALFQQVAIVLTQLVLPPQQCRPCLRRLGGEHRWVRDSLDVIAQHFL